MSNASDALTAQQIEERRQGIGGSDVSAILGLNPWRSPLDVYREKTGELPSQSANERMYWGQQLESLIASEYEQRTGYRVRRRRQAYVHERYPWMRANIDRLVLNLDRILECKSTSERNADKWGEPGSDEIPELYMAQVQHYLVVTGRSVAAVAVLIGGQEYRDYTVEADAEIRDLLLEEEDRFWHEHVLAGVPPAPRTTQEAAQLWPKHSDATRIATPEVEKAVERLAEIKGEQKALAAEEEQQKLAVQAHMGEAGVLLDQDGQKTLATWRHQRQQRIDTKALKAEHPELAERYASVSEFRQFLVK